MDKCEFDRDPEKPCYTCGLGVLRKLRERCPYRKAVEALEELKNRIPVDTRMNYPT